jgi:hypothetical protein
MNDEEYNMIQGILSEFNPKIDTDFTEWVHLIRYATIEILSQGQPIRYDQNVIQLKQMDSNDLLTKEEILISDGTKETRDEISYEEQGQNNEMEQGYLHEFDKRLDVIK